MPLTVQELPLGSRSAVPGVDEENHECRAPNLAAFSRVVLAAVLGRHKAPGGARLTKLRICAVLAPWMGTLLSVPNKLPYCTCNRGPLPNLTSVHARPLVGEGYRDRAPGSDNGSLNTQTTTRETSRNGS